MSTVNNPYTFNIKSNCGFSTNPLISNNQAKITMRYFSHYYEEDHNESYYEKTLTMNPDYGNGTIIPNIISGNTIRKVEIYYTDKTGFDVYGATISVRSSTIYSNVILNGGPFKNCSIPYVTTGSDGTKHYSISRLDSNKIETYWTWYNYDQTPFDLTIKFV